MKRFLTVALFALLPMAVAAQTSHFKTTQSGAFANVSASPDAFTELSVNVSRGTIGGVTNTNIFFSSVFFAQDFSSLTFTQIFGPIPADDFTGDNTNGLHLNIDSSTLDPNVTFSDTCTLDLT